MSFPSWLHSNHPHIYSPLHSRILYSSQNGLSLEKLDFTAHFTIPSAHVHNCSTVCARDWGVRPFLFSHSLDDSVGFRIRLSRFIVFFKRLPLKLRVRNCRTLRFCKKYMNVKMLLRKSTGQVQTESVSHKPFPSFLPVPLLLLVALLLCGPVSN